MLKFDATQPYAVIDGDLLAFRAVSVALREQEWVSDTNDPDDARVTMELDGEAAKDYFRCNLKKSLGDGEQYIVALSDEINWRREAYPGVYKANRKVKPLGLRWLRQYIRRNYPYEQVATLEADDVLGLYATFPGSQCRLVSDDKDLRTIPGSHSLIGAGAAATLVGQQEADWRHMYQTLIGDTSDGYKGAKGVGPKAAEKLLGEVEGFDLGKAWPKVVEAFIKSGLTEQDALDNARMARILRWGEVTLCMGKILVAPWEPSK